MANARISDLWRIVHAARKRRQRTGTADVDASDLSDTQPSAQVATLDWLVARETREQLNDALEALPQVWRQAEELRLAGLSHRQVGERLGRTEKASERLLSKATERMARSVAAEQPTWSGPSPGSSKKNSKMRVGGGGSRPRERYYEIEELGAVNRSTTP